MCSSCQMSGRTTAGGGREGCAGCLERTRKMEDSTEQPLPGLAAREVLLSPSSLRSPHDRPINCRRGVEARNMTLFGKPADGEDGGLVP